MALRNQAARDAAEAGSDAGSDAGTDGAPVALDAQIERWAAAPPAVRATEDDDAPRGLAAAARRLVDALADVNEFVHMGRALYAFCLRVNTELSDGMEKVRKAHSKG